MIRGDADQETILELVRLFFDGFLNAPLDSCLQLFELPAVMWSGGIFTVLHSPSELASFRDEHRMKATLAGYSRANIEELRVIDHGKSAAMVLIKSTREDERGHVHARVETFVLLRRAAGEWRIFVSAEKEVHGLKDEIVDGTAPH